MVYAFDGRKPEMGRDVYISDQALVIGDVKIRDGGLPGLDCGRKTIERKGNYSIENLHNSVKCLK